MRLPVSERKPRRAALIVSLLLASWAYAGEPGSPLPEPLTLPAALSMADSMHPDVALVEADNAARRAEPLPDLSDGPRYLVEVLVPRPEKGGLLVGQGVTLKLP